MSVGFWAGREWTGGRREEEEREGKERRREVMEEERRCIMPAGRSDNFHPLQTDAAEREFETSLTLSQAATSSPRTVAMSPAT